MICHSQSFLIKKPLSGVISGFIKAPFPPPGKVPKFANKTVVNNKVSHAFKENPDKGGETCWQTKEVLSKQGTPFFKRNCNLFPSQLVNFGF